MAGRIKDEDIALVRERTPIADVIGEYLQLRNAGGGSLKGLCPFHDEKSPSFNVTPSKNLYYCLAGETRVLTRGGVRPIRELAGGRHTVLTRDATWVEAPFHSFGEQPLMRITLGRAGRTKVIHATPEHRWFVLTGESPDRTHEVVTSGLEPGDRLAYVLPPQEGGTADGDGARHGWTVRSVQETDRFEEVFCAVVEEGHAFVLEDDILTGNCFGCGEGGDTISFVQKIEGLSFAEAVESLARQIGVALRYEESGGRSTRRDEGQRQRLLDAHRAAAEFYAEQLLAPGAVEARRFLSERGFNRAHAEHFGLGYAPAGWENLTSHLRRKGFTDAELIQGGLAAQGRRGAYDRFRNRLLWPVREVTGEVVGFGARKLDPAEDGPKYLNSPESPIFHKGRLLYGLDMAKRDISSRSEAVIVEGYTDVMACHLAGVTTAVATCGTAFGEDHLKILRRMLLGRSNQGGKVVFTFDGDAAGQKAAVRAFAEEHGFVSETYVAVQPDGLDPCDLRLQHGDQAVADLVDQAVKLYEFMIRKTIEEYDLSSPEGRIAALDAAAPVVASIRDHGVRKIYGKDLDRWLGILDEAFVLNRVNQHIRRATARGGRSAPAASAAPAPTPDAQEAPYDLADPSLQRERQALKVAVQFPGLAAGFDAFTADDFTVPQHKAVLALITGLGGVAAAGDPASWAARLREAAPTNSQRDFLTRLAVEQLELYGELDEHVARGILDTVRTHSINRRESNLQSQLSRLNDTGQVEELQRLLSEIQALQQERRDLQERSYGGM